MPDRLIRLLAGSLLAGMLVIATPAPVHAQEPDVVAPEYQAKASELLDILQGSEQEERFFAASFLDAIPIARFRELVAQLTAQYGEVRAISQIRPASRTDGTVEITYAKAIVAMRMVLDDAAPFPVIGLQVTGAQTIGDSLEQVRSEIAELPGITGFQIAEISGATPQVILDHNPAQQLAIGSTFKLYVLAELSRQIRAGNRKWDDVVQLDRKSLPSGLLQNWPDGSALTLQTLATLMISISDNSATDMLIAQLGRSNIGTLVRRSGHTRPDRMLPLLTTLEAFALKMPANADLRDIWTKASEAAQSDLLDQNQERLGLDDVSAANLATAPRHIDTVEWFASPSDITRLLQMLHQTDDPVVRQILAINSLIPPGDALRWDQIGGKGGSEPGVVAFAFLAQARSGQIHAVSGSWNNNREPVDNAKFLALMNRLLNLLAR
ncbi:Beta-lactamase class A [Parasphingorhabdus marina DSM 22363]|uniref:Beta-lactamase class A n=1 Tax=Parasphingorhabdus marina DSM 22363 TaxID=1123272 RepID=A0A1N6G5K7_9SPHN|nr:serine hydrolase [Parasphingorhabdus marina]SIO02692.1 Beta-lactamase class A [Parasphingorhabdus marina DSM 22363]